MARYPRSRCQVAGRPGDVRAVICRTSENLLRLISFVRVSIVLLDSGSAESDPVTKRQLVRATLNAKRKGHGAQPGPKLAPYVVYTVAPCVPRSREREKKPATASGKVTNAHIYIHTAPGI